MRMPLVAVALATVLLTGCGTAPPPSAPAVPSVLSVPAQGGPPEGAFREALSAKEALVKALEKARATHPGYRLEQVFGPYDPTPPGRPDKDAHMVQGQAVTWCFTFVRQLKEGRVDGGRGELAVSSSPNGASGVEKLLERQVAVMPKGDLADWKIDSTEAIAIAEREGGTAWRAAHPDVDPARFESKSYAILTAKLHFSKVFQPMEKPQELAGSRTVTWELGYPPVGGFGMFIDATTGAVLKKWQR